MRHDHWMAAIILKPKLYFATCFTQNRKNPITLKPTEQKCNYIVISLFTYFIINISQFLHEFESRQRACVLYLLPARKCNYYIVLKSGAICHIIIKLAIHNLFNDIEAAEIINVCCECTTQRWAVIFIFTIKHNEWRKSGVFIWLIINMAMPTHCTQILGRFWLDQQEHYDCTPYVHRAACTNANC